MTPWWLIPLAFWIGGTIGRFMCALLSVNRGEDR